MTRPGGVELVDGPAAGRYSARRAPWFLRAVVDRTNGTRDLLDQLDDRPVPGEAVHVYEAEPGSLWDPDMIRRVQHVIICPPPGARGVYRHRPDVDGETLRETSAWRAWCRSQPIPVPTLDGVDLTPREAGEVRP